MTFSRYARAFLAYLLLVILYGAWVRITHSGAGCGSHWPTCHGEFIPFEPSTETVIEYTHRLTSGVLGIFGLVFVGWAVRVHKRGRVVIAAVVTLILIIFEALIGAGIVLKELVTDDASVARAVVISIHLANTLTLTGAAALAAFWHDHPAPRTQPRSRSFWMCSIGLILLVITCMSGAVTALGDTLFPVPPDATGGLLARLSDDMSPANHFLIRLRIFHPIIAGVAALYLGIVAGKMTRSPNPLAAKFAAWLGFFVVAQVVAGITNIGLAAPGWMQIIHLLLAQIVWILAVLLTVSVDTRD